MASSTSGIKFVTCLYFIIGRETLFTDAFVEPSMSCQLVPRFSQPLFFFSFSFCSSPFVQIRFRRFQKQCIIYKKKTRNDISRNCYSNSNFVGIQRPLRNYKEGHYIIANGLFEGSAVSTFPYASVGSVLGGFSLGTGENISPGRSSVKGGENG